MPRGAGRNDPRLQVEYRPISALIPYARNARTHSDAQVAEIAASIREFGWTNPILADGENGMIAGTADYWPPASWAWRRCPLSSLRE